jgi:hypothetical protein
MNIDNPLWVGLFVLLVNIVIVIFIIKMIKRVKGKHNNWRYLVMVLSFVLISIALYLISQLLIIVLFWVSP